MRPKLQVFLSHLLNARRSIVFEDLKALIQKIMSVSQTKAEILRLKTILRLFPKLAVNLPFSILLKSFLDAYASQAPALSVTK